MLEAEEHKVVLCSNALSGRAGVRPSYLLVLCIQGSVLEV